MNEARKRRDQARTLLLSTILSDVRNREIELNHPASDEDAADVLRRGIKQRREAAEHYDKAQRGDRAAVRAAIAGGAKDLGQVMGQVMPQFKGRADGKLVNQIVREELAATV